MLTGIDPNSADGYYNKGIAVDKLGKHVEAKQRK
jgi:hypothetical protein